MCGFCDVWLRVCVDFVLCGCVDFVKCGCVYVWILKSVGVCMCGFCKVSVCVCVDIVKCGYVYVWIL